MQQCPSRFCGLSVDGVQQCYIVDVTVPRRSSVFSQSSVQISAGLTDISGLAVAAFDLINGSLSVLRLVFVFGVSQ